MRGQRQQLVIEAILKKLASVDSVTKVGDIIDRIDGQFVTNLTFDDMLSFYKYGVDSSIENLQINGKDCYMSAGDKECGRASDGGTYYYVPVEEDLDNLTKQLRTHLGLSEYKKVDSDNKEDKKKQTLRKQKIQITIITKILLPKKITITMEIQKQHRMRINKKPSSMKVELGFLYF